jgi:hypothetical protein
VNPNARHQHLLIFPADLFVHQELARFFFAPTNRNGVGDEWDESNSRINATLHN